MIDPLDNQTNSLPLGNGEAMPSADPATTPELAPAASNVVKIQAPELPDEEKLNKEFDLVRVRAPVYMWDKQQAAKRTAGAERVAKHREKLAAEGLRQTAVPASLLDEVKAAGGWAEWQAQVTAAAVAAAMPPPPSPPFVVEVPGPERVIIQNVEVPGPERIVVEKVEVPGPERVVIEKVEVPIKLGNRDTASLNLGRKMEALTGWKAAVLRLLI